MNIQVGQLIGWSAAIVLGLSTVYGQYKTLRKDGKPFTKAENIIYGTFSRFAWGLALAWVVYACHRGVGGKSCIEFYVCLSVCLSVCLFVCLSGPSSEPRILLETTKEYSYLGVKHTARGNCTAAREQLRGKGMHELYGITKYYDINLFSYLVSCLFLLPPVIVFFF